MQLQDGAEASLSQQTGDAALRKMLRRDSKSMSIRHRAVSPMAHSGSPAPGRSPSPPRQFRGTSPSSIPQMPATFEKLVIILSLD